MGEPSFRGLCGRRHGYSDEVILGVRKATGNDDLLTENWDGEAPLLPLLADILSQEEELIGTEKPKILAYLGCDRLVDEREGDA